MQRGIDADRHIDRLASAYRHVRRQARAHRHIYARRRTSTQTPQHLHHHVRTPTHTYTLTFSLYLQPQKIDALLRGCIGEFLAMLQDSDLHVRRVALVTFNSAAHNKPSLIRDLLETVLPHLYNETKVSRLQFSCPYPPLPHPRPARDSSSSPYNETKVTFNSDLPTNG